MKQVIKFRGYEITVTGAKLKYVDNLTDMEVLTHFINYFSLIAKYAARYNKEAGYNALAKEYSRLSDDCYEFCDKLGLYNKYREDDKR